MIPALLLFSGFPTGLSKLPDFAVIAIAMQHFI